MLQRTLVSACCSAASSKRFLVTLRVIRGDGGLIFGLSGDSSGAAAGNAILTLFLRGCSAGAGAAAAGTGAAAGGAAALAGAALGWRGAGALATTGSTSRT